MEAAVHGGRHISGKTSIVSESRKLAAILAADVVGFSMGGGAAIHWVVPSLPVSLSLWSVLMAVGFSLAVGVFFGVYPARRASLLDPIEALRYE